MPRSSCWSGEPGLASGRVGRAWRGNRRLARSLRERPHPSPVPVNRASPPTRWRGPLSRGMFHFRYLRGGVRVLPLRKPRGWDAHDARRVRGCRRVDDVELGDRVSRLVLIACFFHSDAVSDVGCDLPEVPDVAERIVAIGFDHDAADVIAATTNAWAGRLRVLGIAVRSPALRGR